MDTLAALALATDRPTGALLHRTPKPRVSSIANVAMWKMIIGQSIYQVVVIFVLYHAGDRIANYTTEAEKAQLQTMTFDIYVWMQFFNMINVDNSFDFLEELRPNYGSFFVQAVILAGQIIIFFKGGQAFGTVPLTRLQWGIRMIGSHEAALSVIDAFCNPNLDPAAEQAAAARFVAIFTAAGKTKCVLNPDVAYSRWRNAFQRLFEFDLCAYGAGYGADSACG
ncbi:hypothetical protein BBP40_004450 [Aspergillus hancockii]|nr:hypothetical protein BBP40_004450 [Aspergillus hancockii]